MPDTSSGASQTCPFCRKGGSIWYLRFYAFTKQKQKKQAEKEALDPDANYTEDKGDFEIPTDVPDEDEAPDEQDTEPI